MPKSSSKRRPHQGLSRLEFTIALIVIALLASVLLQRLTELSQQVRRQQLHATMVSMQAGATLFHLLCEARRSATGSDCATLEIAGAPVRGVNGWPAASADGIARTVAPSATPPLAGAVLRVQPAARAGRPALLIALGDRHCELSYVQAISLDDSPVVDVVDDSCL